MVYITASELIPESRDLYKGRISAMGLVAGVFTGILLVKLF
jgi:ZIP family zinc transporter